MKKKFKKWTLLFTITAFTEATFIAWLLELASDEAIIMTFMSVIAVTCILLARKDKPVIYIDMDGVLAKWRQESCPEDTWAKGYFLRLDPDYKMVRVVKSLMRQGYDVHILSAVYQNGHAEREKRMWLRIHGIYDRKPVFVPYGKRKEDYVDGGILVDDFSKNLHSWSKAGNTAIKYYNGINGNKGTWKGAYVTCDMSVREIVETIKAQARKAA